MSGSGHTSAARRPQRRGVHVDGLLGDPSVAQAELVDAAPVDPLAARGARGLPFDDHDVAARRPVEQLPDMIGRGLAHQLGQAAQLLARDRPVVERRPQDPVGMPQRQEGLGVARRPGGGEAADEILDVHIVHRRLLLDERDLDGR